MRILMQRISFMEVKSLLAGALITKNYMNTFGTNIRSTRKANCDVDMAFFLMRDRKSYDRAVILSGDGDFLPVLKFLRKEDKKEIFILAHTSRTAREIKRFAAEKFLDFAYLRERLKQTNINEGL